MVFGYAKLRQRELARSVFDSMADKDLVAWSVMISSYADSDQPTEALKLFNEMQIFGMRPDQITMLSVISACANLGTLDQAQWFQVYVDKNGFNRVLSVNNALIDMFLKCRSLMTARNFFNEMPKRNAISWTAMITGFAMHGEGTAALALFDQMKVEGLDPNNVIFIGLLYACSHSGLVEQGRRVFESMSLDFGIESEQQHFGYMVNLFGCAKLCKKQLISSTQCPFNRMW